MRSNDAYGAAHANQYAFARLLDIAARGLGVPRVRLAVLSCNMHVYADSQEAVNRMLHPRTPSAHERLGLGQKSQKSK